MSPWSYSAGRRKSGGTPSTVVRVYERADRGGLYMTMAWDRTASGRPREERLPERVGREEAQALADQIAAGRRVQLLRGAEAESRERERGLTLAGLFHRYHQSADAMEWSEKHRGDHLRARDFWLLRLDGDAPVVELRKERVRAEAKKARMSAGYSPRWEKRKLALLRAAVRWAHQTADLTPTNPLAGISMPDYEPETDDLIYSEADTIRLVTPHPGVDWRVTLLANIAADTGRRLSAMLSLTVDDVVVGDDGAVVLHFRARHDKGGRSALVPISDDTVSLLEAALSEQIVEASGWLIPEGRLGYQDARDKPWSKDGAIKSLHRAEEALGVSHVDGRGYHGLKRRHVTTAMEVASGDSALVGDLTGNRSRQLLENVYRKTSRTRMSDHVRAVRSALKARESLPQHLPSVGGPDSPPANAASSCDVPLLARVDSNHHRRFQRPAKEGPENAEDGGE